MALEGAITKSAIASPSRTRVRYSFHSGGASQPIVSAVIKIRFGLGDATVMRECKLRSKVFLVQETRRHRWHPVRRQLQQHFRFQSRNWDQSPGAAPNSPRRNLPNFPEAAPKL